MLSHQALAIAVAFNNLRLLFCVMRTVCFVFTCAECLSAGQMLTCGAPIPDAPFMRCLCSGMWAASGLC